MKIEDFIARNPYLYHLTDSENSDRIISERRILSTTDIIEASDISNKNNFLRLRRPEHTIIEIAGAEYRIRDQRPLSITALSKCLTHNWNTGDYIAHLNKRVFLWPNLTRLKIHFERYKHEKPVIFRFKSVDILTLHPDAEFCRLNSGATRANSYLGGIAPLRGKDTFLKASKYNLSPSTVAEVTIPRICTLPNKFELSDRPDRGWISHSF